MLNRQIMNNASRMMQATAQIQQDRRMQVAAQIQQEKAARAEVIAAQATAMEEKANSMRMSGNQLEQSSSMHVLTQSQQMKSLAERMRGEAVPQPESTAEQRKRQHQAVEGYVSTKQGAESQGRERKMAEPGENRSEKAMSQAVMLEKQASLYRAAGSPPATMMANELQERSRQWRASAERMQFEDSLARATSDEGKVVDARTEKAQTLGGNNEMATAKSSASQSQPSEGQSRETRSRELMAHADALELKAGMRRATGGPIGVFESLQLQEQSRQLRVAAESMRRS